MDIAITSIGLSQARLQGQAGILVMKKAMETAAQQGSVAEVMLAKSGMEQSVQPHLGKNVDLSI